MKQFSLTICGVFLLATIFFVYGFNDPRNGKQNIDPNFRLPVQHTEYQTDASAVDKYVDSLNGVNTIAGLEARGYKTYRNGTGTPGVNPIWFQGDPVPIGTNAYNGPPAGFLGADYQSVTTVGNFDNWLVSPKTNIAAGDSLSFYAVSYNSDAFPDSIRVMYSPVGDSTPAAGSWVELGRFRILESVANSETWAKHSYVMAAAGANGRFAIRYCTVNGGPSGANTSSIGIDYIRVTGAGGPGPVSSNKSLLLPTPGVNTNYVAIPHQASMVGFGNNITIEGWVRTGTSTTANTVLNKGAGSFDYQLGINSATSNPFFRAGGTIVVGTGAVPVGTWTHLAVTYDGSNIRFYMNGTLSSTHPQALTLGSSTGEMRIGRGNNDPGTGNIEELRLWSTARTIGQIDSNKCRKYPGSFTNSAGLKAVWHFDSTLVDSVSGYNGTPMGTIGYDTASLPCTPTSIVNFGNEIPEIYKLQQNYPNPFNPSTTINFSIPKDGFVELKIYDIKGSEIATLVSEPFIKGNYSFNFNAGKLSSGIYFYKLSSGEFSQVKRMVLVK